MAGHSKWANIKHQKARQDAKRGKVFTRCIRELVVAAKEGGEDPSCNPRLRLAMDKAFAANMSKDRVEAAIARGAGTAEGEAMEEIRYEGYAPGGVAIIVDCLSDNRNRTVAEVRHAFSKYGGNLATSGAVAYMFKQRGMVVVSGAADEDAVMEVVLDAGAEDIESQGEMFLITCGPSDYMAVVDAVNAAGFTIENSEITWLPESPQQLDAAAAESVGKLVDVLDDLDDTQSVYINAEWDE